MCCQTEARHTYADRSGVQQKACFGSISNRDWSQRDVELQHVAKKRVWQELVVSWEMCVDSYGGMYEMHDI